MQSAIRALLRVLNISREPLRYLRGPGEGYRDVILHVRRSCGGTASMDNSGEWCTYVQVAQRLHKVARRKPTRREAP